MKSTILKPLLAILLLGLLLTSGCTAMYGYSIGKKVDERNHTLREVSIYKLQTLDAGEKLIIVRTDATIAQGYFVAVDLQNYVELAEHPRGSYGRGYRFPIIDVRRIYVVEQTHEGRFLGFLGGAGLDVLATILVLNLFLSQLAS